MGRAVVFTAGIIAYDLLCYFSITHPLPHLAAALAVSPVLLVLGGLAWRTLGRLMAGLTLAAGTVALWFLWDDLEHNFPLVLLAQQLSMWGVLCLMFARTLRAGRTALCTEWADRLHGPLTAAEQRYSRRVTQGWSLFFAAMGIISALLFVLAPPHTWSAFNNLWSLPLVAAMFVGEYLVRLKALPHTAHAGLLAALRLYSVRR